MSKAPREPVPPSLADADWLNRPQTRAVFEALARGGVEARAVGGAVRNTLMGLPVRDIDIASPAMPEEVTRLATAAGLKAVSTGLQHGTVTVIADHVPFEVTTLRRDVETDGRRARVAFTDDWLEDAKRRDFTMNALYCGPDGKVFDPLHGYGDLIARRVRFIGDAHERIREDYLRILRFFRFTADYGMGEPDAAGTAACVAEMRGIARLSGERIRAEMLRLLATPAAVATIDVMVRVGLMSAIIDRDGDTRALGRLAAIEAALDRAPDAVLRLAAFAVAKPGDALDLKDRLRLSNDEFERLARAGLPDRAFDPATSEHEARGFIYRHGAVAYTDGALLDWARSGEAVGDPGRRKRSLLAATWKAPLCPVRGADIMALGVPAGPRLGHILSAFEEWWIGQDFPVNPARIRAELVRLTALH